jgi:hypothetical protein
MVEKEDLKDRRGIFIITRYAIDNFPNTIMEIMGKCIIVRAEYFMLTDFVKYEALSPHFDVVPEGLQPPKYSIWIVDNQIEFHKIESDNPTEEDLNQYFTLSVVDTN